MKQSKKILKPLCDALWRYFQLKRLIYKQKHCKHVKGDWLDDHCGLSYYECKKCGKMLIYW